MQNNQNSLLDDFLKQQDRQAPTKFYSAHVNLSQRHIFNKKQTEHLSSLRNLDDVIAQQRSFGISQSPDELEWQETFSIGGQKFIPIEQLQFMTQKKMAGRAQYNHYVHHQEPKHSRQIKTQDLKKRLNQNSEYQRFVRQQIETTRQMQGAITESDGFTFTEDAKKLILKSEAKK